MRGEQFVPVGRKQGRHTLCSESLSRFLRNFSARTHVMQYLFPTEQGKKKSKKSLLPDCVFAFILVFVCSVVIHFPSPHWAGEGLPCCTWHIKRSWGSWIPSARRGGTRERSICQLQPTVTVAEMAGFYLKLPGKPQKPAVINCSRGIPLGYAGANSR